MSHLDTFDPKPAAESQGTTQAIPTAIPGVVFSEHLPKLARVANRMAIVRSMSTETGAHEQGRYLMRTSYKPLPTIRHPALGAWTQKFLGKRNNDLPGNVVVGGADRHPGSGFLGADFSPAPVENAQSGLLNTKSPSYLSERQFATRMRLSRDFDRAFQRKFDDAAVQSYVDFYRDATRLMNSSKLEAFDIKGEPEKVKELYGDHAFGQGCLLARRLVQAGVRCIEVEMSGWDNHRDIFQTLPAKAAELDQGLSTLIYDLEAKGLLSKTLVVLATEFGRTPKINQNAGRDHHPAVFSCALAGGGVRGGQVYGASDSEAAGVQDDPVSVADFNATIAFALGLPLKQAVVSPSGRPFKVAHDGEPITALF